ncbi:hypothetical protein FDECE_7151 [Fusarium decemcellulare]|nr:hypothetical protein FDECE_7151 [Fusarium decemcellulare]
MAPSRQTVVQAPKSNLMFVNVTRPDEIKDRKTQRKIHRHVMKPIGLTRRKKPRNQKIQLHIESESPEDKPHPLNTTSDVAVAASKLDKNDRDALKVYLQQNTPPDSSKGNTPSPWNADHGVHYSHTSARAHRIIDFLKGGNAPTCQMLRELGFTLAIIDDAAMHVALACLSIQKGRSRKRTVQESDTSLEHYNTSVTIVNQQIQNISSTVGDAIIGIIIGLASYDLCLHNFDRWSVHMAGLQKLIEMRGGIEKISSRYLQTALIWSDLIGSMSLDSPQRFSLPGSVVISFQTDSTSLVLNRLIYALQRRFPDQADVCTILGSLASLQEMATGKSKEEWTEDSNLNQALHAITEDILSLPRHAIPDEVDASSTGLTIRESIRLASMLFLTEPAMFYMGHGNGNRVTPIHRGRLPNLLRSLAADWTDLEELELWVLVICALTEVDEDRDWAVSQIIGRMQTRGLDWDGVLIELRQIAWMDTIWSEDTDELRAKIELTRHVPGTVELQG